MAGEGAPRVALYLPDLSGGGAERMMVAIARGLSSRGVRVDLVLAKAQGPYLDDVPGEVQVVDLQATGVMASLPGLVRYLRRSKPASALGTLPYASLALLWASRLANPRMPVYIREASTPSGVKPASAKTAIALRLSRTFYRRANGVVAVSAGVASDVHDFLGVPRHKITTIYNPVVGPELERLAAQELRHPWFEAGSPPVLLSVGRLGAEKDFPTLLRAFARVRKERPARLMILGEGGERERLERLAEELGVAGDFELPGFVRNPLPYMARSALYVLSSEREGLPGSLIQAMATGCPVASTDCPHGPREVLEDGRYGPLVPVGDDEALARAIMTSLAEPASRELLMEGSRRYSEERSIDQYQQLLLGNRYAAALGATAGASSIG